LISASVGAPKKERTGAAGWVVRAVHQLCADAASFAKDGGENKGKKNYYFILFFSPSSPIPGSSG